MSHQKTLLLAFCLTSLLVTSSCTTTNNASATTPATGYHKGKYYLTESEKSLTAEQLQLRIKEEAKICATPGSDQVKKSAASNALQVGCGLALGINIDPNSQYRAPATMAKARMRAYNDRLVELEQPPLNINGEIQAAIAERNAPPEVQVTQPTA